MPHSDNLTTVPAQVRLYLLGPFRLTREEQSFHLATRKVEALLAFLALHPESHAREKLAALFWGDSTDEQARRSLRTALASIRKELGDVLLSERDAIELNPGLPLWVDARVFEESVSGDPQSAVALYQGHMLADFYDDWILRERERLHALYLYALLQLAHQARCDSQYPRAVEFAQKVLTEDPANEKAYQHIIFCLAASGDRAGALKRFEECKKALRDELGVEPSQETIALCKRIEQELVRSRSLEARLTNLPNPLTSFIGREAEISEIQRSLGKYRLVTLTGPGGCGKTRLAIEVAGKQSESFQEGVWWVDLTSLSDATLVPQRVAQVLGLREQANQSIEEGLVRFLQGKHLLLILDNCEHLIAACARLVDKLLSACSQLNILATSREALGLAGEMAWRVPSLLLPESPHLLSIQELTQYDAVRLFAERAETIAPRWKVVDHALAVVHICRRLDGIPLAIELAAARMKVLSVEQIATRLDDRFRLLTDGSRTALPRHQTLRAAIDWSYGLLSEQEQMLLNGLAVFATGWTLESAEQVCAGDAINVSDVLDLTAHLVDKSLVIVEEHDCESRYRMLSTIREYALERLKASAQASTVYRRYVDFFVKLVEEAESGLQNAEQARWLDRLETEHDNLRAALDYSKVDEWGAEPALRLTAVLWRFWELRGYFTEGRAQLEAALAPSDGASLSVRAKALAGVGTMAWLLADFPHATAYHEQALAVYRQLGDRQGIAFSLNNLAAQAMDQGQYVLASIQFEQSLALAKEVQDWKTVMLVLHNLAEIERYQGHFERAAVLYNESLSLSHELKYASFMSNTLVMQAVTMRHLGQDDQASAYLRESLAISQELGLKLFIAAGLEAMAGIECGYGHPSRGVRLLGAANVLRNALKSELSAVDRVEYDSTFEKLRAAIDEKEFSSAWEAGQAMTAEQAVAYALEQGVS